MINPAIETNYDILFLDIQGTPKEFENSRQFFKIYISYTLEALTWLGTW